MGYLFLNGLLYASHYAGCFTLITKLWNIDLAASLWGYYNAHFADEEIKKNQRSSNLLTISDRISSEVGGQEEGRWIGRGGLSFYTQLTYHLGTLFIYLTSPRYAQCKNLPLVLTIYDNNNTESEI